jgi:hypothetical protein
MEIQMTKNLHIEHPCDTILSGDLSVLDWFTTPGNLSVKFDGSPAICFGQNPATGRFAVSTKSCFNKIKIKIAHSHEEIDQMYSGEVARILHLCFDNLPRTSYWIQGDFVGEGGFDEYTPNTITYKFPEIVPEKIIIAPHTIYTAKNDLREAIAYPLDFNFEQTTHPNSYVKWVQPKSYILHNQDAFYDVEDICNFARQMSTTCNFISGKQLAEVKKAINSCIREQREVEDDAFECDPNLIRLWKLVKSIKEDCLFLCRNDGPEAYLGYDRIDSEGYVMVNKYGMYKLVNREVFSHANFNMQKNWNK